MCGILGWNEGGGCDCCDPRQSARLQVQIEDNRKQEAIEETKRQLERNRILLVGFKELSKEGKYSQVWINKKIRDLSSGL